MNNTRIIRFRGKRTDGKGWEYGYLDYDPYKSGFFIHVTGDIAPTYQNPEGDIYSERFEVLPDSVGMFTGLVDKNNKEAYFGDLCHLCKGYGKNGGVFCIEQNEYGEPYFVAADNERPDIFRIGFNEYFVRHRDSNFEIIGSIHDNPELLNPQPK